MCGRDWHNFDNRPSLLRFKDGKFCPFGDYKKAGDKNSCMSVAVDTLPSNNSFIQAALCTIDGPN